MGAVALCEAESNINAAKDITVACHLVSGKGNDVAANVLEIARRNVTNNTATMVGVWCC